MEIAVWLKKLFVCLLDQIHYAECAGCESQAHGNRFPLILGGDAVVAAALLNRLEETVEIDVTTLN